MNRARIRIGAPDWLTLAAAPTFAAMAMLTVMAGHDHGGSRSAIDGMLAMYVLMSAFHLPPWLRLFASRRG